MNVGDTVLFDFPGHLLHGRRVRIVSIEESFNIAPRGAEPEYLHVVFVEHPSLPEPFGTGLHHIGGTVENAHWRAVEREDDGAQGSLAL